MLGKGGDECESAVNDRVHRGIQPRVFEYLFQRMSEGGLREDGAECESLVKASYFEIYNEQIMDLLNPTSGNLQVREDLRRGVFLEGIAEETVTSVTDALQLLKRGTKNRHVAATEVNFESSRSHSVLTLTLEAKVREF
jgi:hypothetical protein